jgi:hypothetical protein
VADIENVPQPDRAAITVSLDELRILVHRLAPEGTFLRHQAGKLLPEGHEVIAEELAETLRRFHDRGMRRTD